MPKTIQQTVRFAASPEELFDSYLDPGPEPRVQGHVTAKRVDAVRSGEQTDRLVDGLGWQV